jgi:CheY-like chemotaxis protein
MNVVHEMVGKILLVCEDKSVMREVARGRGDQSGRPIEWVAGASEAVAILERTTHDIVLVVADKQLKDGSPFDIFQFVRHSSQCPYPGLALGLTGEAMTEAEVRRAVVLGCLHFLERPLQTDIVPDSLLKWPLDRTDFIVSGSYSGPDRRRDARRRMVERRTISGPAEQTVASTGLGFNIKPSTTVFRFRRMPSGEGDPALALRNGLVRGTVEAARGHIRLKQEQAMAMLGHTLGRLQKAHADLVRNPESEGMIKLHALAQEAGALTETRGLLLVGAIARSLIGHSDGTHSPVPAVLDLLRLHLEALKDALLDEIIDDGGPIGGRILDTLKAAEGALPVDGVRSHGESAPAQG